MSDETKRRFVEALKNGLSIPSICRELDLSRSTAHSWKQKWLAEGDGWYAIKKRTRYSYSSTTGLEWRPGIVVAASLQNPTWGCDRIAMMLNDFGVNVSSPTVQGILLENGLGTQAERRLRLETAVLDEMVDSNAVPLTEEQLNYLQKPRRPEIIGGMGPGETLVQDTCWTGARFAKVRYRASVITDVYGSRIFCTLHQEWTEHSPSEAIDEAVKALRKEDIFTSEVITDWGREFGYGDSSSNYAKHLEKMGIRHEVFGSPGINPKRSVVTFEAWKTIVKEFLIPNRNRISTNAISIDDLDYELYEWLKERRSK